MEPNNLENPENKNNYTQPVHLSYSDVILIYDRPYHYVTEPNKTRTESLINDLISNGKNILLDDQTNMVLLIISSFVNSNTLSKIVIEYLSFIFYHKNKSNNVRILTVWSLLENFKNPFIKCITTCSDKTVIYRHLSYNSDIIVIHNEDDYKNLNYCRISYKKIHGKGSEIDTGQIVCYLKNRYNEHLEGIKVATFEINFPIMTFCELILDPNYEFGEWSQTKKILIPNLNKKNEVDLINCVGYHLNFLHLALTGYLRSGYFGEIYPKKYEKMAMNCIERKSEYFKYVAINTNI